MSFLFFKHQKNSKPQLDKYNPFAPLKYFPEGLTIQTPENIRYILNSRSFLNIQCWGIIDSNSEKNVTSAEYQFGFIDSRLEHLANGEIAAIGTLPLEIGEEIDERIANTIGETDKSRINHYYKKVTEKLKQGGQNPATNPLHSLIILYSEKAAIENERLGVYFSQGKWQLINSKP